MPRNSPIVLLIIAFGIIFFSAGHATQADDSERKPEANLTERHASERRAQVAGTVSYQIDLELEKTKDSYGGEVTVQAKLLHKDRDLTLDFTDGRVDAIMVNGQALSKDQVEKSYNGYFIRIPKKLLKVGENTFSVTYTHAYSKSGNGLYRMTDPADGRVYTYTNFEPYFANHLVPSFDQPDIKGRFQLNIKAPAKWEVISARREVSVTKSGKAQKLWAFPTTKPISTYILPLHAGDYHIWEDKVKGETIPLRLFARQSLKKYVDHKEWFTVTRQGFKFFNEYFGYQYPFEKYDQLIVPDFNWGAMENVGAVTFTERYAPRSEPTREQRMRRANTILHEMAHMWFGNLVTMRWWNDLWLNESFATYMANLALVEATEFQEAWDVFYKDTKQWAYWEDGLVTRHPITTGVPNTDQAFANFDGITYGKGASTLKQLAFFIGPEPFKIGMRQYFRKHAFSNTQLTDFIAALAAAAKTDLSQFSDAWLKTSGTNRIKPAFTCDKGKLTEFTIEQSAPSEAPRLRSHRTKVALYQSKGASLTATKVIAATYSGRKTNVPGLVGSPCPDFVNLNFDDHDFAKQSLDPTSMKTAETSLSRVSRKLDRMMIWASLWDMVEQTEIDIYKFDQLARAHIDSEEDDQILSQILSKIVGRDGQHSVLNYQPQQPKAAAQKQSESLKFWEEKFLERLKLAPTNSDAKKIWFDYYVRVATSPQSQANLLSWLSNSKSRSSLGIEIDQDRRWAIISKLSELGVADARALIAAESKTDKSSMGELHTLTANALRPDPAVKQTFFKRITNKKSSDRLAVKKAIMDGLFPVSQEHLHRKFADEFFNLLPSLARSQDAHFTEAFIEQIVPTHCSQSSNENLRKFVSHNSALPAHAIKPLRVALQMDERCHTIREFALSVIESGAE